jgi:uncharacterized protein involved in response to NO
VIDLPIMGWRLGLSVLLLLICVIGGRIIPAFTGNWLRSQGIKILPVMFGRFDAVCILSAVVTFVFFIMESAGTLFLVLTLFTAALHLARLYRWRGWQTRTSPIVLILHVSYLWVPVGFLLLALAELGLLTEAVALHAWTIGAVGSTTLAVMTRASLGHAGLPLENSRGLSVIYLAISLAVVLRVGAGIWFDYSSYLINISGVLWAVAYLTFLIRFAPLYMAAKKGL